jgi:hypothetical protein
LWSWHTNQVFVLGCLLPSPRPKQVPYSPCKEKIGNLGAVHLVASLFINSFALVMPKSPFLHFAASRCTLDQKASRRPSQFTLWSIGRARALTGHCTTHHIGWRVSSFCWSPSPGRLRTSWKRPHVRQQQSQSQSQSLPLRSCS